jgi:lipopolysaccharide/colanic/teichoic acid biosynthesis glycosyltransferase
LFDLLVAIPLVILLLPLMLLMALWIKLGSPGPVLFKQERIGLKGIPFNILKYRTMRPDSEKEGLRITVGKDPRITPSGQVLRACKMDELPQLFNVIKGDMSLVGPRPEVSEFVACYTDEEREKVLSVRPGITDYAAIEYRNENAILELSDDPRKTYIEEVLPVKIRYYLDYVDQRSLWMDICILFKTAWAIFR